MSLTTVPMPSLDERIAAGLTPGEVESSRHNTLAHLAAYAESGRRLVADHEASLAYYRRRAAAHDALLIKRLAAEGVSSVVVDGVVLTPFEDRSGLLRTHN